MKYTVLSAMRICVGISALFAVMLILPAFVIGQTPATPDQVAAFKQSLAKNSAALKKYQWVETTTVSLKGEVKSTKQNNCLYGADGKVMKTPIAGAPQQAQPADTGGRGGRLKKKIIANKKEELTEYMKDAVELVGKYVPPNADLIKSSKESNNIKVEPVEPNKIIRLTIPNYYKKGDMLSATLNLVTNAIVDVNVSTYLDSEKDKVNLTVVFSQLADGTNFAGKTTLSAPAKDIVVVTENGGHKPI